MPVCLKVELGLTGFMLIYVKLPGERDNARCTQARKTTHGLDGQHQDMDRTPRGRVSQNDRGQR